MPKLPLPTPRPLCPFSCCFCLLFLLFILFECRNCLFPLPDPSVHFSTDFCFIFFKIYFSSVCARENVFARVCTRAHAEQNISKTKIIVSVSTHYLAMRGSFIRKKSKYFTGLIYEREMRQNRKATWQGWDHGDILKEKKGKMKKNVTRLSQMRHADMPLEMGQCNV